MANTPLDSRTDCVPAPSSAPVSRPRERILIVDNDAQARSALSELLRNAGHGVETAADGFKALGKLQDFGPDLLLTDLRMPGLDGLDLMRRAKQNDPDIAMVVMTGSGDVGSAVNAMRQGATDYLSKPLNLEELEIVIDRALERRRLRREAGHLRARLTERHRLRGLVGSSAAMQKVCETVLQVAPSRASVIISGESGTGKELIAAAIHEHSARASHPFIKLHCAALAETLLESELFGHERGSFTGAIGRREGRFHQADGGTLFLDEIGEISPNIQVKLLRFLQEREFERVGGNDTIKVDVRIVAATNKDLLALVHEGKFREDLYYRLNVVSIEMPPLRARTEDIPLLATHFLAKYAAENDKSIVGFSDEALSALVHYAWPGNVRELENAIERAVVVCRTSEIRIQDLIPTTASPPPSSASGELAPPIPGASMADLERYAIFKTLEHVAGSTTKAAEILGISPRTIQYRLREYAGIPRSGSAHGGDARSAARSEARETPAPS